MNRNINREEKQQKQRRWKNAEILNWIAANTKMFNWNVCACACYMSVNGGCVGTMVNGKGNGKCVSLCCESQDNAHFNLDLSCWLNWLRECVCVCVCLLLKQCVQLMKTGSISGPMHVNALNWHIFLFSWGSSSHYMLYVCVRESTCNSRAYTQYHWLWGFHNAYAFLFNNINM